ncbi:CRISPR-associated DxTHG motif protein [Muribaculaceae bacterium Isolate-004 (NCI)]|uniref:CRISPR-associated DxTHG motif protein n=1 Tax=Duncaniella dubosii TaxID=2518971 RepID=A0A4P7W7U4_9BACT|nr:CRISPR-associated DxTHG motif protein [Duncaniella dubosii]RXE63511.1 CRISPR-associated DxTHG motif protein [Muribaculaceae bacterium Isolate-004 (NCI)]
MKGSHDISHDITHGLNYFGDIRCHTNEIMLGFSLCSLSSSFWMWAERLSCHFR